MASVNKVIIVGNLGRDPEMRTFPSGDQVANVTIATTDKWKDKQSGEMREATEWHRVVFNGRLAEIGPVPAQRLPRSMWKAACARASGPTSKPARSVTPPKSAPTPCRCWAAARAWAAVRGGYDDGGYGGDAGGYDQAPRRVAAPQRPAPAPAARPAWPLRPRAPRASRALRTWTTTFPF